MVKMKNEKKSIKRRLKKISHPITCALFLCLGFFVRMMNWNQTRKAACALGDFAYFFLRIRRRLAEDNLARSFPGKTQAEIKQIARQVYRYQVLNMLEMLRIPLIKSKQDAANLVEINAADAFHKTIQQKNGAILVSAHLGSWEVPAICTGMLLTPVNVIIKPLKNTHLDRHLNRWRTMHGNRVIFKDRALREGLKVLRNGEVVGVLGDQSNREGNFYVDFLGRKATVFLGPAFLALKAGVPVFTETCKRDNNGKYLLEITEVKTSDLSYNKEDIKKLAQRYTRALEEFILGQPEEWLWLHDRWKRSPP